MLHKTIKYHFLITMFVLLSISSAHAGGALTISTSGVPAAWPTGTITYNPEAGECATFNNAAMLTKLADVLALWEDVSEASVNFESAPGVLGEINGDNYATYVVLGDGSANDDTAANDGYNPVIFDDDGQITAAIAGDANVPYILGFAQASVFSTDYSSILNGEAVLNCRCLENHPLYSDCEVNGTPSVVTESDLNSTILHEMGHFLNLDHSEINRDLWNDENAANDVDIPIMYPISFDPSVAITPRQDDQMALAEIYPSSALTTSTCLVKGTLLDVDGNELRCADIFAETGTAADGVSFVSGDYAIASDNNLDGDTVDDNECESGCGDFQLRLVPGKEYTLTVNAVESGFTGGSSVGPCVNGAPAGIVAEEIATISSAQCSAGNTIELGSITTTSTGGVVTTGSDTGSGAGGHGGGPNGVENPVGYGCSLNQNSAPDFSGIIIFGIGFAILLSFRRNKPQPICPSS